LPFCTSAAIMSMAGKKEMKYTIIIEKGHESGYVAYAPALKGCVSQGKTKAEALKNVKEAMEAYIEALLEDGLPVPTEVGKDTIELEVAAK
jgi:predicted RNase H-like HicB family nuclease